MKKEWKEIDFEDCPECGDSLECFTHGEIVDGIQQYYDDDDVRCLGECGVSLQMSCDEGRAWVRWND